MNRSAIAELASAFGAAILGAGGMLYFALFSVASPDELHGRGARLIIGAVTLLLGIG